MSMNEMSQWNPNLNAPIPPQWERYVTQQSKKLEIIPAHCYDTENFVSGVTRSLDFFVNIQGKNLNQTNMKAQRFLTYPESMLVENIRIFFKNPVQSDDSGIADAAPLLSSFNDLVQLSSLGVVQITIGEKQYGPFLPWTLPANSFVKGGFSTGSDLLANYGQLDGALYPLRPELVIATQQSFQVTISWPAAAAITLSTGAESELPIVVLFDGKKSRAVQ
jgi:hypothetical protein